MELETEIHINQNFLSRTKHDLSVLFYSFMNPCHLNPRSSHQRAFHLVRYTVDLHQLLDYRVLLTSVEISSRLDNNK